MTSLNFSVWLRLSSPKDDYRLDYKKMLHDIRFRAPLVLISDVSIPKRLVALLAFVSPGLVIYILEMKKRAHVR